MSMTMTVEPKRDRYGRYLIPDPHTGRERSWTRVTTLADTLDDRYNLERWKLRTALIGVAERPDLLAMAAAHKGDKRKLDKVADDAMEAGKSSSGANLGTALHAATERLDRGELVNLPAPWDADLRAYQATAIDVHPDWIERVVVIPELSVAGTMDRLVRHDGRHLIGDVKTGASAIDWAMGSIAIQLACYAHATHWFDPATGDLHEIPTDLIDRSEALVIWLPAGEARCELHVVDIAAGWEAAQLCAAARVWRARKDLSRPLAAVEALPPADPFDGLNGEAPAGPASPERRAWIVERMRTLAQIDGALDMLARRWPEGVPTLKQADGHTDAQLDAIAAVLDAVETQTTAPFGEPDPTTPRPAPALRVAEPLTLWQPIEGDDVDQQTLDAMRARVEAMPREDYERLAQWVREAADNDRPFSLSQLPSVRRFGIVRAAVLLAALDAEDVVRALLGIVLGEDIQPAVATGTALGVLSIEQADRLAALAEAFASGRVPLSFAEDGTPVLDVTAADLAA